MLELPVTVGSLLIKANELVFETPSPYDRYSDIKDKLDLFYDTNPDNPEEDKKAYAALLGSILMYAHEQKYSLTDMIKLAVKDLDV